MPTSQSAPTGSPLRDRGSKPRRKEFSCETCGKVYRHPNCLIKHRWEHTPHWRDTAQFLLSKHQQVQVMEAAAILVHGSSLPSDRALWPSYMTSGASLSSPRLATTAATRETRNRRVPESPAGDRDYAPGSVFDEDDVNQLVSDEEVVEEEGDEDEQTDESDTPMSAHSDNFGASIKPASSYLPQGSIKVIPGRARAQSATSAVQTARAAPFYHSPYGFSTRGPMVPTSPPPSAYTWGVIGSGDAGLNDPSLSQKTEGIPSLPAVRSPMAIPHAAAPHSRTMSGQYSLSSLSSIGHSYGSSTGFHIPSSSIRSRNAEDDSGALEMEEDFTPTQTHSYASMTMQSLAKWASDTKHAHDYDELEMEMD